MNGSIVTQTPLFTGLALFGSVVFAQRMILLGQMPLSSVFQYRIKNRINRLVAEKTISLPYSNIEDTSFQTTLAEVRSFADNLPQFFFHSLSIFQAIISIFFLSFHFRGQAWLILPLILGQIPGFYLSICINQKQYNLSHKQTGEKRLLDYYLKLSTDASSVKERELFSLNKLFLMRWNYHAAKLDSESLQFMKSRTGLKFVGDAVSIIAFLFCVVMLLLSPSVDAARFASLTTALLSIQSAFSTLILSISNLHSQLIGDKVVFDFLEFTPPTEREKEPLSEPIQSITFSDVSFSYKHGEKAALENITVELYRGETVAIVGENGAGKTTFIKMLLGLYQPDTGCVLCNKTHNVCDLEPASYFRHISAIFQEYNQYPLTAAQNIDLFSEEGNAPTKQVISAAKQSGADAFIEQLPQKYQTRLTSIRDNGIDLSGGQWQRLAIARGILKEAELLIMDEPTSSLDPLLENEIMNQFLNIPGDALKLIVSHRIGISSKADRILVFRDGRLEEIGTHAELMKLNGYYAELYSSQADWYEDREDADR